MEHRQARIKAAYDNHIIRAEIAALAAFECAAKNPAESNAELTLAIHHLTTATTQLQALRPQQPTTNNH